MLLLLGLLVQRTVLLTMLPLGLRLAIVLPLARLLTAQLLALMVVVVLSDLLLQTVVMRRQLAAIAQR